MDSNLRRRKEDHRWNDPQETENCLLSYRESHLRQDAPRGLNRHEQCAVVDARVDLPPSDLSWRRACPHQTELQQLPIRRWHSNNAEVAVDPATLDMANNGRQEMIFAQWSMGVGGLAGATLSVWFHRGRYSLSR